MHTLKIKILDNCPNKEYVTQYYLEKVSKLSYEGDAGIDLIFPEDITFKTNTVTKCGMGIACEFIPAGQYESGGFDLVARSSIADTPLMLTNCVGIFDAGYRGEVIAAFRCFIDKSHQSTVDKFNYNIEKGKRLVQIVAPDRKKINVVIVEELSPSERGVRGLGSTNLI